MIRIRPTTSSGLSHTTYAIDLPGNIYPHRPRAKKIATTIDGGVAISLWRKRVEGATITQQFLLHPDKYKTLLSIVYHNTNYEWVVHTDENHYVCVLDITSDTKRDVHGNPEYHNVSVEFIVVREL